jgi:hypothetical protein
MTQILDTNELMFNNFEPKQPQRFVMYIGGIPTAIIRKTDRPKMTSSVVTVGHINVEKYYKGKSKWEPITVEILDYIVPSGMQLAMEWARLGHESATGRDGYWDMYAKDVTIKLIGPPGDVVEEWTLKGAWQETISPDGLDWQSDGEALKIPMTVRYNYALLQF